MRSTRLIGAILTGCLLCCPSLVRAESGVLPPDVFTAVMMKTLNYDRNAGRLAKDKVVIAVVILADDALGKGFADTVNANIVKAGPAFLIKDKPVAGKVLPLARPFDKAALAEQLTRENVSVLVVLVNDPADFKGIVEAAGALQISTVCREPACAGNGAGLGIVQKDNKPRMVVDLAVAKAEGSDFSSNFLAMCDVLK